MPAIPKAVSRRLRFALLCLMLGALSACSISGAKKSYVLAEKLWTDGQYSAAVSEFEKVVAKDPRGKLGRQALFRAATTQALFLSQYGEAIRKLKTYVAAQDIDEASRWEAQKLIGDILYSKTEQYDLAIQHYTALLSSRTDFPEKQEFQYRIAKAHFYLGQFDEAIRGFRLLSRAPSDSVWAENATYEIGVTFFTRGEQNPDGKGPGKEAYQEAIDSFQYFIRKYPKSGRIPEAQFGIASCLEEMDQLDAAYHAYEALQATYPSPKVIAIKLARIRERKTQRSR